MPDKNQSKKIAKMAKQAQRQREKNLAALMKKLRKQGKM